MDKDWFKESEEEDGGESVNEWIRNEWDSEWKEASELLNEWITNEKEKVEEEACH